MIIVVDSIKEVYCNVPVKILVHALIDCVSFISDIEVVFF